MPCNLYFLRNLFNIYIWDRIHRDQIHWDQVYRDRIYRSPYSYCNFSILSAVFGIFLLFSVLLCCFLYCYWLTVMFLVLLCCCRYCYYDVFGAFLLCSVQLLWCFRYFFVAFGTFLFFFGIFLLLSVLFCCFRCFFVVFGTFTDLL